MWGMFWGIWNIWWALQSSQGDLLRTKVRGDFNIHGTKYFYVAVFHQKSKKYDVVSLLYLWWVWEVFPRHLLPGKTTQTPANPPWVSVQGVILGHHWRFIVYIHCKTNLKFVGFTCIKELSDRLTFLKQIFCHKKPKVPRH